MLFCNYCGFFTTFAETYERREPTPGPERLTGFMGVGKKEFSPWRSIKSFVVPLKKSLQVEQQKVSWKLERKAYHWYGEVYCQVIFKLIAGRSLQCQSFCLCKSLCCLIQSDNSMLPFPPLAVLNLINWHENRPQQTARRRGHASHRAGDLLPASEHSLSHQPSQVDINTPHTQLQKPQDSENLLRLRAHHISTLYSILHSILTPETAVRDAWLHSWEEHLGQFKNYLRAIRIFNMILINSERTNIWSDEIRASSNEEHHFDQQWSPSNKTEPKQVNKETRNKHQDTDVQSW